MDNKVLLAKSIALLYHESKLKDQPENSADLIRTVLEAVQVSEIGIGLNTMREIVLALKTTILEMCNNPLDHEYDRNDLLQRIRINTENDDKYYEAIKQGLDDTLLEPQLKRSVGNIKKSINNHFKEQQINDVLNKASYAFKFQREKIKDTNQFISELLAQLEPLQMTIGNKDPAIIGDVDIGDDDSMRKVFDDVKNSANGTTLYKTGWQALNRMLSGGFREGETTVIGALQHKYKTGFSLSLFSHFALYNTPVLIDPTKKPLLLRISFEDDLDLNLKFLYQSLKYDETREPVNINDVSSEEMRIYVKDRLQVNGFHIKMIRVDPTQWTYKSICNKIIELEAQGFEVKLLMLDYLSKISTIGCTNSGILGADVVDLWARIRNFSSAKKICTISPHQFSTEAKNLLRTGMPEDQFVNAVSEKGYYEKSKSIDTVVDLELYIHLFKHNKETFFSVGRGKHRGAPIIEDIDKYFLLKFPKAMPIPTDINGEDSSLRKLPSAASNASDDLFKVG